MSEVVISVDGVSKTFRLPHEKNTSIKSAAISFFKGGDFSYEKQQVLKDVSFEVKKGEFFGIVGRNGSGKSTLLKMLAGIYSPTKGSIDVKGTLTPFIELGVGFNPELTGRENVYLNGALLGFSRKEVDSMYEDVVEFAELERFMDQKLKNYSSGMQVRLAFSIAIKAQGDVLLIDEVLAVGDAAFQKKCFDYFMKLKKEKRTVILVTHDMGAIRQYCDRAIMIEKGKIVQLGKVEKVAQAYQKMFSDELSSSGGSGDDRRWGSSKMKIESVLLKVDQQTINISVEYKAKVDVEDPVFGFNIYNSRGVNILEGNTIRKKIKLDPMSPNQITTIRWSLPNVLAEDTYTISASCCNRDVTEFYDWWNEAEKFVVSREGNTAAVIDPPIEAKIV